MRENNYSKIEMKKRLAALLVAFVFMFGTAVIPSQIYAIENDDQAAAESVESEAVTEEAAGADETAVDAVNPGDGTEEVAESETPAEEETETTAEDLSELLVITDANGNSIDLEDVDKDAYDGFIYRLKDDTTKTETKEMDEAISELDGGQEVEEVIDRELYAADSLETIGEVAEASQIEIIEPNYIVRALGTSDPYYDDYGEYLEMINAPYVWDRGEFGEDAVVAVLDTGVKKTHEDLQDADIGEGYNFVANNNNTNDDCGHGTSVTGVIVASYDNNKGLTGIMPEASIIPVKVLDKNGKGTIDDIIAGIDYAINSDADVINMSLGNPIGGYWATELERRCDMARDADIILVAAAGNEALEGNPIEFPASYDSVVSVGAVNEKGLRASFSNYNKYVAITAPGEKLFMPSTKAYGHDGNWIYYTSPKTETGREHSCGTSFAAPQVSAMAAMVKSVAKKKNMTMNHEVFMDIIACTSVDKGAAGYDMHYGYGLMDLGKAYRYVNGDISACRASLSGTSYTYNGSAKTPSVSVRWLGKTLAASNYSISYSSGRTAVGTYKVTVAGKGSLYGSKTLSFNVVPPLVKGIKSPSRAKKKLTVRWKAMSKKQKKKYKGVITGYQVRVSTNASFSGAKYVSVKGLTKTKATVKGLKKKTKYYVQYRSYKTTGSGTYYSKWSGIKRAKTK